jgi:outer membrane protein
MRSFVRAALAALALMTVTTGAAMAQSGPKIAYINSQKILAEAPGRAEAEAEMQKEMEAYKAEVQKMGDSLNAMVAAYQKVESTLSPTARAGRQQELQKRETEYQQRVADLQHKAQQREAELVQPIMQQIDKIIEQVRAENGYAIVFDAGNQSGVVVAADSTLDITNKVIAKLKSSPSSTTKPAPKPAAGPTNKPTGATRNPPQQR